MAIKRVTYNTLSYLVAEIKDRYAEKSAIGALGGLDKVAVENLADDLKKTYKRQGKCSHHACGLRHHRRNDSNGDSKRYFHGDCWNRPLKPCNGRQYGRY